MVSHRYLTQLTFEKLVQKYNIPKGGVLDAGSRNSDLCGWFERMGFKWIGIDRDAGDKMEEKGKVFYEGQLIRSKMEETFFPDQCFDIVFCCHAFEHVENPSQVLREFKRLLTPDGYIYISMPVLCEKLVNCDFDHINILMPIQMKKLCDYVGLELIEHFVEENDLGADYNNQNYLIRHKK